MVPQNFILSTGEPSFQYQAEFMSESMLSRMWRYTQYRNEYLFFIAGCFLKNSHKFMWRRVKIVRVYHQRCNFSSLQQDIQGKISVISSSSIPQWGHSPLEGPQKFTFRVLCLTAIILFPPWAGALTCCSQEGKQELHTSHPCSLCKQAGEFYLFH